MFRKKAEFKQLQMEQNHVVDAAEQKFMASKH